MSEPRRFGFLNLHKPAGMTSRDVVDRVVRLVRPAKAGHAGTLDPLATGVLVVGIGAATRLVSLVQEQPKSYRGSFRLGAESSTDDREGEIVERPDALPVSRAELERALPEFLGAIAQVPPQYSAVHVQGERAYRRARRGEHVELAPRTVEVHRLEIVEFDGCRLTLDIDCGSGTYIRSIGRDLGRRLGCGAFMTELVRTAIGPFTLEQSLPLDALDAESLQQSLLPPLTAVSHLPRLMLSGDEVEDVQHGRRLARPEQFADGATVALVTTEHALVALAHYRAADGLLAPKNVLG